MFEFYLAASEVSFRRNHQMVWQLQMTNGYGPVPLTRDYIAAIEAGQPVAQKVEASSPLRR